MEQSVGIIGLGLAGSALSAKLLEAGVKVSGYDIAAEQMRKFALAGGSPCGSPSELAARCELVFLSLPTLAESASVVGQMAAHLKPGAAVIDTTTGAPQQSCVLESGLARSEVAYIEALIGGSSSQVRAGEAILICGGARAAFDRCEPLFRICFGEVFYLGACGMGSRMKLVLNLVLGLNRAVLAEGLTFAAACGIEPAKALDILRAGPAYSRVMDTKGRRMLEGDFQPEARLSQHLKDVRIILSLGEQTGARLPLSTLHRQLLEEAEAAGYGAVDNCAIIRAFCNGGAA